MNLRPARGDDVDEVVALVADQQAQPERNIAYLGTEADSIRAELEGLESPWLPTARVVRDSDGRLVAAALAEWDEDVGRMWIYGPWVAGGDDSWIAHAGALVEAVLAAVPAGARRDVEMSGDVANVRVARLATDRGLVRGVTNYVLEVARPVAATWLDASSAVIRPGTLADVDAIRPLHDAEFPGTYFSAEQLAARADKGQKILLCAEADDGRVVGYAAGQVQSDGDGFIDFVAVYPSARGHGIGRSLVSVLAHELFAAAPGEHVYLTVQEPRTAARALYDAMGFGVEAAIVGFRTPAELRS